MRRSPYLQDSPVETARRSVTRRRAVIVPLIKGIAIAAVLLGILISGGILWALRDTPIAGEPARSDRPSLVLETADGRPLGRTGALSLTRRPEATSRTCSSTQS